MMTKWRYHKLGDYVKVTGGNAFKSTEYQETGTPLLRISNIKDNLIDLKDSIFVSNDFIDTHQQYLLNDGNIVIAMSGATTGKTGVVRKENLPLLLNQRVGVFKVKDKSSISEPFLQYVVQSTYFQNILQIDAIGGAQPNISPKQIESINIYVPSIQEQQKIAAILSSIDDAIEKTEQVIEQTETVKRGLMQELLTKGIGHTEFKDSPVGKIPKKWNIIDFVNIADSSEEYSFVGGPFGSDLTSKEYTVEGVRIIQLQNIGDGEFLNDHKIFTSGEKADALYKCNIFPGDIIIAKMADPVARACIIPNDDKRYLMASDGIRVKVNESKYDKRFVLHAINSPYFRKQAIINSTGTTRLRIGLNALRRLKMAIPPFDEQSKISKIIDSLEDKLNNEKEYLVKLQNNKQGLMQQLLTGKKRVNIDDIEEVWS